MEKAHCKTALHSHFLLELLLRDVLGWGRETLPRKSISPLLPIRVSAAFADGLLFLPSSAPLENEDTCDFPLVTQSTMRLLSLQRLSLCGVLCF